ncbi:helix-turn-helix domain-containing protein [Cytophagaceae bacterium YF14B1]|uniref:Helix-turn-helix domain-containing protein n=1 Tax=Xanthocytophaga flava TaxID=3048013 RepID=A0AAE3QUI1_9BACT|nr:helix-turn-helix domain-containing protein [Xanthocytophaga flavus]MDJ1485712.1 helix-turn-helix domain-containing protein [Xanthocytophaga flavus]
MHIQQYFPREALKPFIKQFVLIESEHMQENRILPDTSIVLAFRCKGLVKTREESESIVLPSSVITGIRTASRTMHYTSQTTNLLVVFTEHGASAFFKEPLFELTGISTSLDNLIPAWKVRDIEAQLAEVQNTIQRIRVVEQFLMGELKVREPDLLILNSLQKIRLAQGNIRIKELVQDVPLSRDPFEKRFRRVVGTSPKQFASIVRLRNFITTYSPAQSLTEAAYDAGYFDQSHFIKSFRLFTGQAPHNFFRSASFW